MELQKKVPKWENNGAEPSEDLKRKGFTAGYKPPAAYFNWLFNGFYESVKEIQQVASSLKGMAFKDSVTDGDITEISGDKVKNNFTVASARGNIASGEKLSLSLGKMAKWFTDLKAVAWTGSYTDLTNRPTIPTVPSSLPPSGTAGGELSGSYPNPTIPVSTIQSKMPTYAQASTRANLVSGTDTIAVVFGKLQKWFADLKPVAWSGSYTDLANRPTIPTVPSSLPPSGAAGGELGGTYPNPTIPVSSVQGKKPTYTQATTRGNLSSGSDTISVIFGKLAKWYTDLKTVAWTGSYTDLINRPTLGGAASQGVANNLTTTAAGFALDARQGKALKDSQDALNQNLMLVKDSFAGTVVTNGAGTEVVRSTYACPKNGVLYITGIIETTTFSANSYFVTKILKNGTVIRSINACIFANNIGMSNIMAVINVNSGDILQIATGTYVPVATVANILEIRYIR